MTKDATNDAITSGLEQMNAVLKAWWTLPAVGAQNVSEAPVQQVTDFASDLQKIYSDTFERHRDLLMQGMKELASWTPATMQADQPQTAMEAPLKMMASLLEASSKRAEIWTDMSSQLGARYAALAASVGARLRSGARRHDHHDRQKAQGDAGISTKKAS